GDATPSLARGERLAVQVVDPSHDAPDFSMLDRLEANDLVELNATENTLSKPALRSLERLGRIESIGCKVRSDDELRELCKSFPHLQALTIIEQGHGLKLTDSGLESVRKLRDLRGLRVQSASFTRLGFREIAQLPRLEGIVFAGN